MSGRPSRPERPAPVPEVETLVPYEVAAFGRLGLLRLDANENTAGPSPRVLERLRRIRPEDVSLYPDETEAREAVARFFGLGERGEQLDLVLTSGVDEGIRLVCDCFVRAGERVVLLAPAFPMYGICARLAGAAVIEVSYRDDLSFPEKELKEEARRGCRLMIVPDPNNPTGTPAPAKFVEDVASSSPATLIFVDEAYAEFSGTSCIPALARFPNLIVARTFSKAYGLAGLRAGVLLGHRELLSWIARMRAPYAVNSLALIALVAALEDADYARRYAMEIREARSVLAAGLERLGVACHPGAGNFLMARFGDRSSGVREALRRRGILVKELKGHPLLTGALRVGVGTLEEMNTFLRETEQVLAELVRGGPK